MRKSWKLGAVSVALVAALGLFGCSGGDITEQKADEPAAPQTETQTPEAAQAFLQWCMTDEDANQIWEKWGFELAQN